MRDLENALSFTAKAIPLLVALACASLPATSGVVGELPEVLGESSGLVRHSTRDDLLWTHNDSGDRARIFAIDLTGNPIGEIEVVGADAVDWEAITSDGRGRLLIGDVGNNRNQREDLTIYVIPEPDPGASKVEVEQVVRFRYPEQKSLPDTLDFNFDAEAMFWWKNRLFLLTKHRSDQNTALYMFPERWDGEVVEPVRVSETSFGSDARTDPYDHSLMVTDAALSPNGRHLAILTYAGVVIFAAPEKGFDFLAHPVKRIYFNREVTIQCEGLAWIGDSLYMTNEQLTLHRLSNPLSDDFQTYP